MKYLFGNIWDHHDDCLIVIPTNIGWKSTGENVMGAGLAAQAATRYEELPRWYGKFCKKHCSDTPVTLYDERRLILFPTKPLNRDFPWLSWQSKSNLFLIERSLKELVEIQKSNPVRKIVVPYVGCGNGQLPKRVIAPLLTKYLTAPTFYVIEQETF